ncbi:MAG TPA: DNA repair protein RecN [Micropepsaceae bacterium]|nr:DNA repair protein RecN [Micropepsaceae bacterium]
MLTSLIVRDIVLIERAELSFSAGLNVLTGETGAGKSILLDALGLAAGERANGRACLRSGAEQAVAVAGFELPPTHPARAILHQSGIAHEEGELVLRRVVSADGRSRAFIDDQPVGVQLAREIGSVLVEVHGQADDRGLFDPASHRTLLDAFGGNEALAAEVAGNLLRVQTAKDRVEQLRNARDSALRESEFLRFALDELAKLSPQPGEEAELASTRALMMNAGRLAQDIAAAFDFVGGDGGAEVKLSNALRRLSRLPEQGRDATKREEEALESALVLVQDARSGLEQLLTRLNADPAKLEQLEERLFALRAAARKYNVTSDALPALAAEFGARLAALESGETSVAGAEAELTRNLAAYRTASAKLSSARAEAAKRLEDAVAKELGPLKLGGAKFRVAITPLPGETANGLDRIAFEIATIEGGGFGPLTRIASGGELARFALALKVALAESSPPAVLVFDEVDRGVGGAVAAAVGERLQKLARNTQVLLVTHSPQVAARAVRHFRIVRGRGATSVQMLSPEERVEEIARMLSGASVTDEARAAARRLLAEASVTSPRRKRARA